MQYILQIAECVHTADSLLIEDGLNKEKKNILK